MQVVHKIVVCVVLGVFAGYTTRVWEGDVAHGSTGWGVVASLQFRAGGAIRAGSNTTTTTTTASNTSNTTKATSVPDTSSPFSSIPAETQTQRIGLENPDLIKEIKRTAIHSNTVFVTSGNWAFRDFLSNVEMTTREAYPDITVVAFMLDDKGFGWCKENMKHSICVPFRCDCPYTQEKGFIAQGHLDGKRVHNFSEAGYTVCLLGIYICKLKVKLSMLELGLSVFFIDGDAVMKPGALSHITNRDSPVDMIGACETCTGSCTLHAPVESVVDAGTPFAIPKDNYRQINIGFFWLNCTKKSMEGVRQAIHIIVKHGIDVKSVDQTVVNRRWIGLGAERVCLPPAVGGLNIKSRSAAPKIYGPEAWGIHAARLVNKNGFYKRAFLYLNNLWRLPVSEEFKEDALTWRAHPSHVKKKLKKLGLY